MQEIRVWNLKAISLLSHEYSQLAFLLPPITHQAPFDDMVFKDIVGERFKWRLRMSVHIGRNVHIVSYSYSQSWLTL